MSRRLKQISLGIAAVALAAWATVYGHWRWTEGLRSPRPAIVDQTIGLPEVCEVHHVKMERRRVQITYGDYDGAWSAQILLARSPAAFLAAKTARFPHAMDQAFGGCLVTDTSPLDALIFVCPTCLVGLEEWQKERRADRQE